MLGTRDEVTYRTNYTSTDLQNIQIWEDIAQDAATVLEANIEVVKLLRDFYIARRDDNSFLLGKSCGKDVTAFAAQVTNLVADMMLQVGRAKAMIARASSRKSLVDNNPSSLQCEFLTILGGAAPSKSSRGGNGIPCQGISKRGYCNESDCGRDGIIPPRYFCFGRCSKAP